MRFDGNYFPAPCVPVGFLDSHHILSPHTVSLNTMVISTSLIVNLRYIGPEAGAKSSNASKDVSKSTESVSHLPTSQSALDARSCVCCKVGLPTSARL